MIKLMIALCKKRGRIPRSRLYRCANRTIASLGMGWLLLVFFPHPLFAHSVRVGQFHVHSDRPIQRPEIKSVLRDVTTRLRGTQLFSEHDSFHIFIAHDSWRRRLLTPRGAGAFGSSMVLTGNTILNRCDLEHDVCRNDQPKFNARSLHSVIAHECTHHMIYDRVGFIDYLRLPTWKNEGYCEYVAGAPTFDRGRGLDLLRAGRSNHSHAFRYLTYQLAVQNAIEDRGMTVDELLATELGFQLLLESAVNSD